MSTHTDPEAPRLPPRPLYRPEVDPASAAAFGRPRGHEGSFTPESRRAELSPRIAVRTPDPVLAEAFGRPADADESLQRDPDRTSIDAVSEPEPEDPWRDPNSSVRLGNAAEPTPEPAVAPDGPKLGVREVLFGERVAPKTLVVLGAIALAIGLVGGLVGRETAEVTGALTSQKVNLTQSSGEDLPQGQVAKVADAVLPAVVSIQVTLGENAGTGSGVVIDGAGYIVTNNHVISMAATNPDRATLQVTFSDGTKVPAKIVGRDTKTDLAVLKTDVGNLTVAQLGNSADVQVGEDVVAVGSPLGLNKTVTRGIVSALDRPVRLSGEGTDTDAVIDAVQTDAAINPGNSGGPLIDAEGRVIGINSAIRSESGGSVGLGFAIPIDDVTKVAQSLIANGKMQHPDIGINARSVINDATSGAEVANVRAGGPAQEAGIVEGDVITKVGDRNVTSADELVVAVQSSRIGESTPVQLIRSGRLVDVTVTPISD
ncbi:trypsin-like peptidase domain-containing protein [Rhodococcus sp. H29-C3]|uniref:S1C family serine protease n=1 Tax=Rhodococcus sp. H29-C3 TaxID=3046307 RepID=UPI0024B8EC06|nr:trypsin-like peptidase domain-containing protein [Rhodococcus sp. H29-C3]MDJ0358710.1 trypsin-like peptidase domain-containing protein [Rhodococcus sp. H29-C3]